MRSSTARKGRITTVLDNVNWKALTGLCFFSVGYDTFKLCGLLMILIPYRCRAEKSIMILILDT